MSMLVRRWSNPPCTNMYVTNVHGRVNAPLGENWRTRITSGEVNSVMSRSRTTAFAMTRRPTQGVIRYEGEELMGRKPLTQPRRDYERFSGGARRATRQI